MRTYYRFLIQALLLTLVAPALVFAQGSKNQCKTEARQTFRSCSFECKDTKEDSLVSCVVPSGDCGNACRAGFEACKSPLESSRDLCRSECDTTYEASRTACATQCSCSLGSGCNSNACYGECIEDPIVTRAECKADCFLETRSGIRACTQALRACSKACK